MTRVRVGVLRGGPGGEYEVSLQSGSSVLAHLPGDKYEGHDILVDRDGTWHFRGMPVSPEQLFRKVDVIFNGLHGTYGEDGTVQKILDTHQVPYTGSAALASAIGMNKHLTKKQVSACGVKTPRSVLLGVGDDLDRRIFEIFRTFPQPSVVKPVSSGSSVGVTLARDYHSFVDGVARAFEHSPQVLIEEYIAGTEATCGVVEGFRGEEVYTLLPVEIVPPKNSLIFDYDAKYTGISQEICPGNFSKEAKETIQNLSKQVHKELGLRHYSRSDFIVSPRGIYFLEVNTLPGLTPESLVPKALAAVGATFPEFVDHLLTLALSRK